MTLDELKTKLIEMAGLLIDEMEHVPAANIQLAQGYLVQSRVCLKIARSPKLLKKVYKQISDGEHTLSNIVAAKDN